MTIDSSAPIADVTIPASGAPADVALPSISIPASLKGRIIRANLELCCNCRKNSVAGSVTFGAVGGKIYVSSDNGSTYPDLALNVSGHGQMPSTGSWPGRFSYVDTLDISSQANTASGLGYDLAFKFTQAETSGPQVFDLYDCSLKLHCYIV